MLFPCTPGPAPKTHRQDLTRTDVFTELVFECFEVNGAHGPQCSYERLVYQNGPGRLPLVDPAKGGSFSRLFLVAKSKLPTRTLLGLFHRSLDRLWCGTLFEQARQFGCDTIAIAPGTGRLACDVCLIRGVAFPCRRLVERFDGRRNRLRPQFQRV